MLSASELEVWRGPNLVLNGFNLRVEEGRVTALLGGNGSGKSTALYALSGLAPVRKGRVTLGEKDVTNFTPRQIVRAGIGHVPQGREVFSRLSVRDNLDAGAAVIGSGRLRRQRMEAVLEIFPMLREKFHSQAGTLSGGEQQQVAIARALMPEPKLLLMDEPSAGLSPIMVDTLIDTIRMLRTRSLTILLVEQNVGVAAHTADRAVVLKSGKIVLESEAKTLLTDKTVLHAYLGR